MGFVDRMDQNVAKYKTTIRMKKCWWSLFAWMVDDILQIVWVLYRISKDEYNEPLPLLSFRRDFINVVFLKYSKEGRSSSSHVGIRNVPSDICYDDTKHYQVLSEKKRQLWGVQKELPTPLRKMQSKSTWYLFWNILWILANVWY